MTSKPPEITFTRPTVIVQDLSAKQVARKSIGQAASNGPQLDSVSFHICEGEAVGILGDASDGISILSEVLAGRLHPVNGNVFIRPSSCLLDALATTDAQLTLEEVIERVAMTQEVNGKALKRAVARTARQVKIDDNVLGARVSDLSVADVDLARLSAALNTLPSVLIAMSTVATGNSLLADPGSVWFERYLSRGGSALIMGSDTRTMVRACSRIIWFHSGKIIMDRAAIEVHREFNRFQASKKDRLMSAQLLRRYSSEYRGVSISTISKG